MAPDGAGLGEEGTMLSMEKLSRSTMGRDFGRLFEAGLGVPKPENLSLRFKLLSGVEQESATVVSSEIFGCNDYLVLTKRVLDLRDR